MAGIDTRLNPTPQSAECMWGHQEALKEGWRLLKWENDLSIDDRIARASAQTPLDVFEAYAGAGGNPLLHAGWAQAARDRGHNVKVNELLHADHPESQFAVDLGYTPDLAGDIRDITADDIMDLFGGAPDVFFASPPCEGFSTAARHEGWLDWGAQHPKKREFNRQRRLGNADFFRRPGIGPKPNNPQAELGRSLMNHTLGLADELQEHRDADDPMFWWLENPTGMMRYQPEMGARHLAQPMEVPSVDYPGGNPPPMKTTGGQVPKP